MSYYTAREEEFSELANSGMFGVEISREGNTATGIATPSRVERQMTQAAYMPERTAIFDLLRTDKVTLGIDLRKFFTAQSKTWECVAIDDDAAEPTVRIYGVLKK